MARRASDGWRLGDLVVLQRGTTYKSSLLGLPGPVLLGLASIQRNGGFRDDSLKTYGGDSPDKLILEPGDIYVSLKDVTQAGDLLGAVSRVPAFVRHGRLTQDTLKISFVSAQPPRELIYWVLRTPEYRDYCRAHAIGTTNLSLTREDFLAFPIPAPTPATLTLTRLLEAVEERIALNRRLAATLEGMARALFKSWFVDFDPVRAKAEDRDPSLPVRIAGLFPDDFEDSELGEIPRGWRVGALGEVANHPRRGIQPDQMAPTTPYIALEHMPRRSIALSEWGVADGLGSNKFEFRRGEILFGKLRPYFHKVGVAPVDGVCSTDIVVVAPKASSWFGFVLFHVSSVAFVDYTNAGSTGTRMPRTSWDEMARYPLALPPEGVATAFATAVRPAVERIAASVHESRTLAALRDALLPKLVSGEIRVNPAAFRCKEPA